MNHETLKEQLFSLYDGELDAAARKEVEAHLAGCQECREFSAQWAATAKVLFKRPKPESTEFFVRQVMERVHALETPKPSMGWQLSLRWLAVPALGLAALFLLTLTPSLQSPSTETLLMGGGADSASQWIFSFSKESPKADEVLGYVMEGS